MFYWHLGSIRKVLMKNVLMRKCISLKHSSSYIPLRKWSLLSALLPQQVVKTIPRCYLNKAFLVDPLHPLEVRNNFTLAAFFAKDEKRSSSIMNIQLHFYCFVPFKSRTIKIFNWIEFFLAERNDRPLLKTSPKTSSKPSRRIGRKWRQQRHLASNSSRFGVQCFLKRSANMTSLNPCSSSFGFILLANFRVKEIAFEPTWD